ncbi:MAG: DUF975 family protein [Firmicutes bacterium]|nr:DUF975 family protein [Bacillota bacterium]
MENNNPRKIWKKNARQVLKTHYILLLLVCVVIMYYGTEFGYIRTNAQNMYQYVTGQEIQLGQQFGQKVGQKIGQSDNSLEDSAQLAVLRSFLEGDIDAGRETAEDQLQEYEDEKVTNAIKGRKHGIFAGIANTLSSGRLSVILFDGINSIFNNSRTASVFVVVLNILFSVAVWIFLKNVLSAVARRIFLEARLYPEVPVAHVLHFKLVGRWIKASLTMLMVYLLEALWWLTIVGGAIKHYSYRMVPFIVAEDPDIGAMDSITLSRKIMDGHKMECFKLDLSFILWYVLGIVTFGISDAVWTAPYTTATFAEYYAYIRGEAKAKGIEGAERLNDTYLF